MLDTSQLNPGDRCLYKNQTLIYQRVVKGTGKTPYHIFKTPNGKEKRLSQPTTARDVWVEIFIDEAQSPLRSKNRNLTNDD